MRMDGNLDRYLVECTARCLEEIEQNKRPRMCVCVCIRICIVSEHILNVKYADVRGRRRSAYLRKYIMYLHTVSKSGYAFIFKGILISKLRINYVSSKLIELIDDLIKFDNF